MPKLGGGGIQGFHLFGMLDNTKYSVGEVIVDANTKMHDQILFIHALDLEY